MRFLLLAAESAEAHLTASENEHRIVACRVAQVKQVSDGEHNETIQPGR